MKKSTRMLLMTGGKKDSRDMERESHGGVYSNYGYEPYSEHDRSGYRDDRGYQDMEDKFRDRRGREHYDNGKYAPMRSAYDDTEMRRGGRRQRDSMGRFTSEYEKGQKIEQEYYPMTPYISPVYERYNERSMPRNKVGFSIDGEMEHLDDNRDMERHKGNTMDSWAEGGMMARRNGEPHFDHKMAMEWTEHMENEDGTTGPHWTMEQTKKVMAQKGLDYDPLAFYVALNATYSDLCKVFKKHNINNIDAYTDFAVAFWLNDKDAIGDGEQKLADYYYAVVEH